MRLRLTPLMLLPLLAGCALGPTVPTPDVHTPVAFEAPTDVTQPGVPLEHWWTTYNDPQLETLVEQALINAPDARSGRARLEEALATRAGALASYGPQGALQGSGTETYTKVIQGPPPIVLGPGFPPISFTNAGTTQDYLANFDVSWEIDIFGRQHAARGKANADLAAARLDNEATRTELEASVADQLFQARGLAIQLDDAREANKIDQELADISVQEGRPRAGAPAPTPTRPTPRPPRAWPRPPTWKASCTPPAAPFWCWSARGSIRWRRCPPTPKPGPRRPCL